MPRRSTAATVSARRVAARSRRSNAKTSSSKTSSSCRDTSSARNAHWNSESPFRNTFTCSYFRFKPPRDAPGGFNEPVRRSSAAAAAAAAAKGGASAKGGDAETKSFSPTDSLSSSSSPDDVSLRNGDARRSDASLPRSRSRLRFTALLAACLASSAAHAARSSSKREPFSPFPAETSFSFSFSFSFSSSPGRRRRSARDGDGPRRAPPVSPIRTRSGRGARARVSFLSARRFSRSASRRCRAFASRRAHSKRRALISSAARRRSVSCATMGIPSSPSFTRGRSSRSRLRRAPPDSPPRRLRRAAASRSRRRSCLRSARRNAMPCSSRTSNSAARDVREWTAPMRRARPERRRGRGGGGGRGSGAPRRDPRRDAPRRPSVEPSRNNDSLVSFSRSSRTLMRRKVLLCHDVAELHLAGRGGPGLASVARVVSSAREPRGPHNTGHMPAGPFASSVGVGRAEPEWAALNKVTGVCGEGTRA